jgi:hypothetical protein
LHGHTFCFISLFGNLGFVSEVVIFFDESNTRKTSALPRRWKRGDERYNYPCI